MNDVDESVLNNAEFIESNFYVKLLSRPHGRYNYYQFGISNDSINNNGMDTKYTLDYFPDTNTWSVVVGSSPWVRFTPAQMEVVEPNGPRGGVDRPVLVGIIKHLFPIQNQDVETSNMLAAASRYRTSKSRRKKKNKRKTKRS
jgi:hypothetical protein